MTHTIVLAHSLGALAGGIAGAAAAAYWAFDRFALYGFALPQNTARIALDYPIVTIPRNNMPINMAWEYSVQGFPIVYDWPAILLWVGVGFTVGAFLGLLAVSLLRTLNRRL